jgi:aspartyl-tRNA(Asn)/glutamyl-tRNA(Gln) amidotransferase subunit C
MSLDIKQIEHLAQLARLELTDDEKKLYLSQLEGILGYFKKLAELDTTGVESLGQAIELQNVLRTDEVLSSSADFDKKIIGNAPCKTGRHIRVKKIL